MKQRYLFTGTPQDLTNHGFTLKYDYITMDLSFALKRVRPASSTALLINLDNDTRYNKNESVFSELIDRNTLDLAPYIQDLIDANLVTPIL